MYGQEEAEGEARESRVSASPTNTSFTDPADAQRRWEAAQKRQRKRAESAAARHAARQTSSASLSGKSAYNFSEKGDIPPVPILPKQTAAQEYKEKAYAYEAAAYTPPGYAPQKSPNPDYPTQPAIEEEPVPTSPDPYAAIVEDKPEGKPARPGRSAARVAAADQAAANASSDPMTRYKPSKPSRLAADDSDAQETLAAHPAGQSYGSQNRQTSGEWGTGNSGPSHGLHLSAEYDDPYLQGVRATSGQYSTDPYASYHDGSAPPKRSGGWV